MMDQPSLPTGTAPVAITMGDPAGIGPEIVAQAFRRNPSWSNRCLVVGDVATLRRAADVSGGLLPLAVVESPAAVATLPPGCLPVLSATTLDEPVAWGRVQARAGRAAADAIVWAARAALEGRVSAVVTAPIHKEALAAAGIDHPGHTEFLQALAAHHLRCGIDRLPVRMMLSNDELRVVLISIHVALRDALAAVTIENIMETLYVMRAHFARFGRFRNGESPRIAVAGLNPHAGEGGLFGREEIEVIGPAVERARAQGLDVTGPHAPDTVFMRARRGEFDVVVAMYHDQGLIPVKYMGLEHGVNTTLGLPFVRTSPDHGTAFDLAGSGKADPASLMAAVAAAMQMAWPDHA